MELRVLLQHFLGAAERRNENCSRNSLPAGGLSNQVASVRSRQECYPLSGGIRALHLAQHETFVGFARSRGLRVMAQLALTNLTWIFRLSLTFVFICCAVAMQCLVTGCETAYEVAVAS